jgi:nucleoid DNA-binding protein
LNPLDHKVFIKNIAEEAGVHPALVERFISFYYMKVRRSLSDLSYPSVYLEGLGTFSIRKSKLEKTIKRNRDILGNLEKMTFKGYEKHVPVKNKLDQMEKCLDALNAKIEEKIKWKEEKLKNKQNE